ADAEVPLRTEVHHVENVRQEDGFARVAAVTVVCSLKRGRHARSVAELGARYDCVRAEEEMLAARQPRHAGRVPPYGRGILRRRGATGVSISETAHTLLGESECSSLRVFRADERKRGRNEKREYLLFHWISPLAVAPA